MSDEQTKKATIVSRNPANRQVLGETQISSAAEIQTTVASARSAFDSWSQLSLKQRLGYIEKFRQHIYCKRAEIARLVSEETGKPLIEVYACELFGQMDTCSWLENNLPELLTPHPVQYNALFFPGKRAYNVYEPLGVVAVISPWNYPFAIPVASMLMALATGNAVVLKPSPKTPLVGKLIVDLFEQAGFPKGLVGLVIGDRDEAKALMESKINRVVFTGSVGGGKAIMALAAQNLIPVTLELGGKHPAIVLEDADVEKTAQAIRWNAFTNAGQACASVDRLYVVKPLAKKLAARIAELTQLLRLGEGLDPNTDVGPVIDLDQHNRISGLIHEAVEAGAKVLVGGGAPMEHGYFLEPTVLTNVTSDMRVMKEEIFGPVLPIVTVENEEEALRLANDSNFGLGASIWTADIKRAERLARRINSGLVWINDGIYSHSCPDAPWGGIKESGFGRSHGWQSVYDFVNVKHIGVDKQGVRDWQYPYGPERLSLIQNGMGLCHAKGLDRKLRAIINLIPNWLKTRRK